MSITQPTSRARTWPTTTENDWHYDKSVSLYKAPTGFSYLEGKEGNSQNLLLTQKRREESDALPAAELRISLEANVFSNKS